MLAFLGEGANDKGVHLPGTGTRKKLNFAVLLELKPKTCGLTGGFVVRQGRLLDKGLGKQGKW